MMLVVIYVLLVLCLVAFDGFHHRMFPGWNLFAYKGLVLLTPALLMLADMLTGLWAMKPACMTVNLIVGAAMAVFHHENKTPWWMPMSFAGLVLGAALLASIPGLTPMGVRFKTELLPLLAVALTLLYRFLVFRLRSRRVIALFSNEEVWYNAMWTSASLYADLLYVAVAMLGFCQSGWGVAGLYVPGVLALAVMAVTYLQGSVGSTMMLPRSKEKEIKVIVKGSLRSADMEGGFDDRKMSVLYRKVMAFMKEEHPYLDGEMNLNHFARKLYTNKVYLSRTINVFSGRNFRQFLNWHRVEHSLALMKKDPYLRVEEVAHMSGFNSSVSFNMAFKMFRGTSPHEWLEEYRDSRGVGGRGM